MDMRITPEIIRSLGPNEIFVFGSNMKGLHGGGAARAAYDNFGAEWGNGIGIQGQSYAIPTLSVPAGSGLSKLPIPTIGKYVNDFIRFAEQHPNLIFYVTPIGCGIAGFTPEQIAPLFDKAKNMENVYLPKDFLTILQAENKNKTTLGRLKNMIAKSLGRFLK